MSKILLIFSSHDGQTEGIAERVGRHLSKLGHEVSVQSAEVPEAARGIMEADAVIIGGAIRDGHFDAPLVQLVRANADSLLARRSAFFSVSLPAAKDAAPAQACMTKFQADTGWLADETATFAAFTNWREVDRFAAAFSRRVTVPMAATR